MAAPQKGAKPIAVDRPCLTPAVDATSAKAAPVAVWNSSPVKPVPHNRRALGDGGALRGRWTAGSPESAPWC
jgi:hypothetical protein